MNRKLGKGESLDSSEMMLDTLTNVFGSVILIACVLAILPRHVMPPPLMAKEDARAQMVERRIDAAEAEIKRLQDDLVLLDQDLDLELAELESRRDSLKRTLDGLQFQLSKLREAELDAAGLRALTMRSDPSEMAGRLKALKALRDQEQTAVGASREKVKFLEQRLEKLAEEVDAADKGRFEMVRFPREKGVLRGSFPVIVAGGGIYPLNLGAGLRSNPAVRRLPLADDPDAFRADLVAGRGIKLPEDRDILIQTLKAAVRQDHMISIYLYPDTHGIFQDLKAAIFEAGGSYGVEFQKEGARLTFGAGGTQPPEL